jgi:ABC-2 type transport system permease protein
MIDGFRYGFIGTSDSDLSTGIIYTLLLNVVLTVWVYLVFKRGYRLKA